MKIYRTRENERFLGLVLYHTVKILKNFIFVGCLGQNKPWLKLELGVDPEKTNGSADFRIPPDLIRSGSYTTLKVFKGAPPIVTKKYDVETDFIISEEDKKYGLYGKRLEIPRLGNNYNFPRKQSRKRRLDPLDETTSYIPVFRHLIMAPWKPVSRVPTPECIRQVTTKSNRAVSNVESSNESNAS